MAGCLESIVQYTLLLYRIDPSISSSSGDIKAELHPLLDRLIQIDPMRKGRYEDVRKQLDSTS